jgi:hypothetical protein
LERTKCEFSNICVFTQDIPKGSCANHFQLFGTKANISIDINVGEEISDKGEIMDQYKDSANWNVIDGWREQVLQKTSDSTSNS